MTGVDYLAEIRAFDPKRHSHAAFEYGSMLAGQAQWRHLNLAVWQKVMEWKRERADAFRDWKGRTGYTFVSAEEPRRQHEASRASAILDIAETDCYRRGNGKYGAGADWATIECGRRAIAPNPIPYLCWERPFDGRMVEIQSGFIRPHT